MLLLCVSDIHGQLDALAAVLATAERRNFQKLLVAGDLVFPGPKPLDTWRRLSAAGAIVVAGVTDRALTMLDPDDIVARTDTEKRRVEQLRRVRGELGDVILERIKRLPNEHSMQLEDGRRLLLVHGSPADAGEAMTHDMEDEEIEEMLGDDPPDVVVCGMSHVPFDRTMPSGVRVVNVGSIGEAPDGSGVRPGSPGWRPRIAHATWITSTPTGFTVEQFVTPLGSR